MKTNLINISQAIALTIILNSSCNRQSVSSEFMNDIINTEVTMRMFEAVHSAESEFLWSDFRKKFRFVSIVFLQDGCAPCYPKFIEWHRRMEQMVTADDYTVLFVINARHYENFVRNARTYGEVNEKYYYVMDPNNQYLMSNSSISRTSIDRSILIDKDNRIKMVGEPFANADMTKVFHIVTGVDTQHSGESK